MPTGITSVGFLQLGKESCLFSPLSAGRKHLKAVGYRMICCISTVLWYRWAFRSLQSESGVGYVRGILVADLVALWNLWRDFEDWSTVWSQCNERYGLFPVLRSMKIAVCMSIGQLDDDHFNIFSMGYLKELLCAKSPLFDVRESQARMSCHTHCSCLVSLGRLDGEGGRCTRAEKLHLSLKLVLFLPFSLHLLRNRIDRSNDGRIYSLILCQERERSSRITLGDPALCDRGLAIRALG